MTTEDRETLTDLFLIVGARLQLPLARATPKTTCAERLVRLLEEVRDDLAWALEYADELAAPIKAPAPQ